MLLKAFTFVVSPAPSYPVTPARDTIPSNLFDYQRIGPVSIEVSRARLLKTVALAVLAWHW